MFYSHIMLQNDRLQLKLAIEIVHNDVSVRHTLTNGQTYMARQQERDLIPKRFGKKSQYNNLLHIEWQGPKFGSSLEACAALYTFLMEYR